MRVLPEGAVVRALVYRGPAACEGCAEALAALLLASPLGFEVGYVGGKADLTLRSQSLAEAELYAQPGGGNSVRRAYRQMKGHALTITDYVKSGGRYLGICMGGYLAGHWRGFRLLPQDCEQFITWPGASVTTRRDTLVDVEWRGVRHRLFFQDGPMFRVPLRTPGVTVLARYSSNQEIAAMICPYGRGRVGVCGPHPEAPRSWYAEHGLTWDDAAGRLGIDLIGALMTS
jgi:glutamine amidotransferase-like uncharacterized protein